MAVIVALFARCLARILDESSAQLPRPATRDAIKLFLLLDGVKGIVEGPLVTSSPWSRRPMQLLLAQDWVKALQTSCLADDDYVSAPFSSLDASSKNSCAMVL